MPANTLFSPAQQVPPGVNPADYYALQQRQAIASYLQQQSLENPNLGVGRSGPYEVQSKYTPLIGLTKLAQAIAASKMGDQARQQQSTIMDQYYKGRAGAVAGLYGQDGSVQPQQAPAPNVAPTSGFGANNPAASVGQAPMSGTGFSAGAAAPDQQAGPPQRQPFAQVLQNADLASRYGVPDEVIKAGIAAGAPNDTTRMALQAGQDPLAANADALRKANYVAPYETREGNTARNPFTNLPIATAPKVPAGYEPKYGANGELESIVPIQGGPAAVQGSAASSKAGEQSQTPVKLGVDANGKDVYGFLTPPGTSASGKPNYVSSTPQTLSLAGQTGQKEGGELGAKYSANLAANATGATEVRRGLSELRNLQRQTGTSVSNDAKLKIGSYMMAAGIDPKSVSKFLNVDVGALNAAAKQTASLAVSSIHSMTSRGTNFDLDTFMRNNPNLNMSDPSAFNRVVDYMDNKAKQEVGKQKDFVQWKKGVSPDEWEAGHTAHWLEKQNADIEAGASNSPNPHAKSALMPSADKLNAYAKTHFGGDVNKAKAFLASQGYK